MIEVRDDMTLMKDELALIELSTNYGFDQEFNQEWVIGRTTMKDIVVPIQSYKVIYPTTSIWYGDLIDRESDRISQVRKTNDAYKDLALLTLDYSYK